MDLPEPKGSRGQVGGRIGSVAPLLTAAILVAAGASAQHVPADPTAPPGVALDGARVRVSVSDEAGRPPIAAVRLEYDLRFQEPLDQIGLSGLAFAGSRPTDVRTWLGDREVPYEVASAPHAARLSGTVHEVRAAGGGVSSVTLSVEYSVAAAGDGREYVMTVPLLVPVAVPARADGNFMSAALRLPGEHFVLEAFPTLPRRGSDGALAAWDYQLQVVPALMRWRAVVGPAPLVRYGRVVDAIALGVLLVGGVLAVRILMRPGGEVES